MAIDLLLITPGFPGNEADTTCVPPVQAWLLALRTAQPDLGVAVITTQYPHSTTSYRWNGIPVHPCGGGNARWKKPLVWKRARRIFDGLNAQGHIGSVHSLWLGETALLGARFAAESGAKHVLTLMGQDARDGAFWWKRLRHKPTTVCLSDRHATVFERMTGSPPDAVIPWGIEAAREDAPDGPRDIDVLFVGSLIEVKDPLGSAAVVERLHGTRKVRAVMIGDGPLRARLPSGAGIEAPGSLPRPSVLAFMRRSRVLLHTSTFESQGYVFDEALRAGMRIVSGPVGSAEPGPRWRITEGTEGFARAVLGSLEQPGADPPLVLRPVHATVRAYLGLYGGM